MIDTTLIRPEQIDLVALKDLLTVTIVTPANITVNEVPNGLINDLNQTFTTTYDFILGTTAVYYNGHKLRRGADYFEIDSTTIELNFVPSIIGMTDEVYIVYEREGAAGNRVQEPMIGLKNGSNTVFTTTYDYESGSLLVFYNGHLLSPSNYTETGANEITLTFAPITDNLEDELFIIYNTL